MNLLQGSIPVCLTSNVTTLNSFSQIKKQQQESLLPSQPTIFKVNSVKEENSLGNKCKNLDLLTMVKAERFAILDLQRGLSHAE